MHYTFSNIIGAMQANHSHLKNGRINFINPIVVQAVMEGADYSSVVAFCMQQYPQIASNQSLVKLLKIKLDQKDISALLSLIKKSCSNQELPVQVEADFWNFFNSVINKELDKYDINEQKNNFNATYIELEKLIGIALFEEIKYDIDFEESGLVKRLYELMLRNKMLDNKAVFRCVVSLKDTKLIKLCYNLIYIGLRSSKEEKERIYKLIMSGQYQTLSDMLEEYLNTNKQVQPFNELFARFENNGELPSLEDISAAYNQITAGSTPYDDASPYDEISNLYYISKKVEFINMERPHQITLTSFNLKRKKRQ